MSCQCGIGVTSLIHVNTQTKTMNIRFRPPERQKDLLAAMVDALKERPTQAFKI
ncbi:hypothetical protein PH5382_02500 [Phaeobacter sp. CECT 5382]|nr:hypothetical protein PH5382_02500 [Phaeobacter sp. CECT 5382]